MSTIPSLETLNVYVNQAQGTSATVVPIYSEYDITAFEDPVIAFLKIRRGNQSVFWQCSEENDPTTKAFLVLTTEPYKTIVTGEKDGQLKGDPLKHIAEGISPFSVPDQFALSPSIINGAALGYIGYDCVKYFEPRVAKYTQQDVLQIPESYMMLFNSFVVYDYKISKIRIVALCILDQHLEKNYTEATTRINQLYTRLTEGDPIPYVDIPSPSKPPVVNVNIGGYQEFVKKLRESIIDGYIIQAVPSQRLARETGVHPFNFFQNLRKLNPSRYTFYVECGDFQVMGSSPELLLKVDKGRVVTHPIAGTRRRGTTPQEDLELEKELLSDEKERAEHVMLVDLGRNDVNRVSIPETTNVDSLMHVERFSHVMHIVSTVSGQLRPECTQFDAFRSIFPAGTVSGAPKVQAMEFIATLEVQKRGVYAGAMGCFSFDGNLDTCISIRTALAKNGIIYLQAGGGIVFDSNPDLENEESYHKMAALARALDITEAAAQNNNPTISEIPVLDISPHPSDFNSIKKSTAVTDVTCIPKTISEISGKTGKTTLLIDNYDSFTWNLYQYLRKLGENVIVYRHDQISVSECLNLPVDHVVISPGPGWPKDAGISNEVIKAFTGKLPVLGVCLGHECMTEIFGGEIIHCGEIKHGKTSKITHDGKGVYKNLPQNFEVIRYHSLAANKNKIPENFYITSQTEQGVVMGIRHVKFQIEGVQFHPESIKTDNGIEMLKNFISWEGPEWKE